MNSRILVSTALGILLAGLYAWSLTVNTAVITRLPAGAGFAAFYIVAALVSGTMAWGFASPLRSRLLRRLVTIGSLALGMYACGNAGRALLIRQMFGDNPPRHAEALPVAMLQSGTILLRSPHTGTVFPFPTTIAAAPGAAQFGFVGKCAKVLVEETAAGDKRIAADQPAVTEASVGACSRVAG